MSELSADSPARLLQDKIFTADFQNDLRRRISAARPYNYGVINGLFKDDVLRQARDEIFANIEFSEKETDIYKLNQTGDLLNIDGLPADEAARLATLHRVRDALYSKEMRDMVSAVTGCGPLSAKKLDLSLNNYDKGCHLLTHDDVIGDRVISFILYVLPPDYAWDPKWGGALRVYPTLREGVPASDYSGAVPPQFNQLSFFKIVPGHSFHDVEEVYVDQPRLSIQGWYHLPQPGEEGYKPDAQAGFRAEVSTMAQQALAHFECDGYAPPRVFVPTAPGPRLDALAGFVSESVLQNLDALLSDFEESGILRIDGFLDAGFYAKVKAEIEELELQKCPVTSQDVPAPWGVCAPPHLRKYMYLDAPGADTPLQQLKALFESHAFARLLERVTACVPAKRSVELRRFRPGIDYTLASVSGVKTEILEAVLSVTPAKFGDGVGGYDLIMSGGSDANDDPAVYRESDDGEGVLLSALPRANEFILVLRDPDLLRFVKYVSKNAPGSRWDVHAEYMLADDEKPDPDAERELQRVRAADAEMADQHRSDDE